MRMKNAFCEVRTEFINVILTNIGLQRLNKSVVEFLICNNGYYFMMSEVFVLNYTRLCLVFHTFHDIWAC
jgi:hypothetical protein